MYLSKRFAVLATTAMALLTLQSSAAESPDTALAAYQRNDYETAYRLALPAAQAGDANAQYLLGTQLWRGRGVVRNDVEAAQWFARAAEQNHSDAMTDLAALYQSGDGVEKDAARAFSLLMKAAEAGNATAQFNVGQAFQQGVGVRKDMIHARYWYERADAVQAAAGRPKNREKREPGFLRAVMPRLPESCKPSLPPRLAMRQSNVTEVTGLIALYIDSEGRIRGVTERNISVDALKFDAVALFSASLRSKECAIPEEARDVKIEIPFKFVLR